MNREGVLLGLAQRLHSLGSAGDWDALAEADRALAQAWPQLLAMGEWTALERVAVAGLAQVHRTARELCAHEAVRLKTQLDELGSNKDGWMAYASASEWEEH